MNGRTLVTFASAALAMVGCRSGPAVERERLTRELDRDPVEALRAIGSAPSRDAARALAAALRDGLTGQQQLDLLRFGLASDDERVVFGAVKLDCSALALPQFAHAAAVALPRLGDADCPLEPADVVPLIGGVDVATVAARVPLLSEADATWLLGAMHRMVDADSVPPLCELALRSTGEVRRGAFANATLAVDYSGEHTTLLLATWLRCRGAEPEPERDGLAGALRAALRVDLDAAAGAAPPEGTVPEITCMRALLASRPTAADLPLLRRVVAERAGPLLHGAIAALGNVDDDASLHTLQELAATGGAGGHAVGDRRVAVLGALARRGVTAALDELFARGELEAALASASAARRRAFAAALLAAPTERFDRDTATLRQWSEANSLWFGMPPYADDYVADLEPLAAAAPALPTRTLLRLLACVPCCRTTRLADVLLARGADAFCAAAADVELSGRGDLGDHGVVPFLEVTRPAALRRLLRDGVRAGGDAADLCAPLLLRLGDDAPPPELVAWIDAHDDGVAESWLLLARDRDVDVLARLRTNVAAVAEGEDAAALLPALATALGMPFELAQEWRVAPDECEDVRRALLAGDAGAAFVRSQRDVQQLDARWALLAAWREPAVQQFLRTRRAASDADAGLLVRFDLRCALHGGDAATLAAVDELVRDGRYAMHHGVPDDVRAHAGLHSLQFWIDELGTNCCRAAVVEEVLQHLFGTDSDAFHAAKTREPARVRLRRVLLPIADRLRWSRIADAYVLAGV